MRIHVNDVTSHQFYEAAKLANASLETFNEHRSRSHIQAFEVKLSGDSSYAMNPGTSNYNHYPRSGSPRAATYDQWGIFLGALYRIDPNIKAAHYPDKDTFDWCTGNRYTEDFTVADQHKRHRWERVGEDCTGKYAIAQCKGKDCTAIMRYLIIHGAHGKSVNEVLG